LGGGEEEEGLEAVVAEKSEVALMVNGEQPYYSNAHNEVT
jgi:hypothetical protein